MIRPVVGRQSCRRAGLSGPRSRVSRNNVSGDNVVGTVRAASAVYDRERLPARYNTDFDAESYNDRWVVPN